jgi:hypothetical protein
MAMTDVLAEFFEQFSSEEQAFIRAKEAEAKIILLQGQAQDEAPFQAAATEFVGYQRVLAHRIDPVCTESVERYLRQLDRICEGILARYGRWECKNAIAEMRAEAERLAWISLGKQMAGAKAGTITTDSKLEQPEAGADTGKAPATATAVARRGYRAEVHKWMETKGLKTVPEAARRLGVSVDTLKSIMSTRGKKRYGDEKLGHVLEQIGIN